MEHYFLFFGIFLLVLSSAIQKLWYKKSFVELDKDEEFVVGRGYFGGVGLIVMYLVIKFSG